MTSTNNPSRRRVIFVMLDSVGIGEAPDAEAFGDAGADTLGHIAETVGLEVPNLAALGLGNIRALEGVAPASEPSGVYGRLQEQSQGKDTSTGHWEFCGLVTDKGFRTFPEGFPDEILDRFIAETGVPGVLGNKPASGTVIIEELGREHVATGKPIVYTSADPVFQIAAHENVVPVETLYKWCKIAYDIVIPAGQSRVIARPFVGEWPNYTRTYNRKDFAVPPPEPTLLDALVEAGINVTGVGKIGNIFSDQGISESIHTHGNDHGVEVTLECVRSEREGLIFTNLVDFDALYGHRRNPQGYADCLAAFDRQLPELVDALEPGDLLILSADHGNDPTFPGTDHTREYVPIIVTGPGVAKGVDLGIRGSFADVGQTIAEYLGIPPINAGTSFVDKLGLEAWPRARS